MTTHLGGLNGGVYHFRVVAKSINGDTVSETRPSTSIRRSARTPSVRQQTGQHPSRLPRLRAGLRNDAGNTIIYPPPVPSAPRPPHPRGSAYAGSCGLIEGRAPMNNDRRHSTSRPRPNSGWKTKYVGLPGRRSASPGGSRGPWTGTPVPEPCDRTSGYRRSPTRACRRSSSGTTGHPASSDCPATNAPDASNAPYVWDSTTGKQSTAGRPTSARSRTANTSKAGPRRPRT